MGKSDVCGGGCLCASIYVQMCVCGYLCASVCVHMCVCVCVCWCTCVCETLIHEISLIPRTFMLIGQPWEEASMR